MSRNYENYVRTTANEMYFADAEAPLHGRAWMNVTQLHRSNVADSHRQSTALVANSRPVVESQSVLRVAVLGGLWIAEQDRTWIQYTSAAHVRK